MVKISSPWQSPPVLNEQRQDLSLPAWAEEGFQRVCRRYVLGPDPSFRQAVGQGQGPRALVVACADSRVDPALLLDARPGKLFVVRNVAALVPPPADTGHLAGVSAAPEFAVRVLQVPQVLVIGHSLCGGVRAYLHGREAARAHTLPDGWSFFHRWKKKSWGSVRGGPWTGSRVPLLTAPGRV